jgi:predicted MarR family transcription regulator
MNDELYLIFDPCRSSTSSSSSSLILHSNNTNITMSTTTTAATTTRSNYTDIRITLLIEQVASLQRINQMLGGAGRVTQTRATAQNVYDVEMGGTIRGEMDDNTITC